MRKKAFKIDPKHRAEIRGLKVRLQNGALFGTVVGVYDFGAGDVIDIEKKNGKMEMLPLKEPFIEAIYADKGYMVIAAPEYVEAKAE